jgi:hypothetical protein
MIVDIERVIKIRILIQSVQLIERDWRPVDLLTADRSHQSFSPVHAAILPDSFFPITP